MHPLRPGVAAPLIVSLILSGCLGFGGCGPYVDAHWHQEGLYDQVGGLEGVEDHPVDFALLFAPPASWPGAALQAVAWVPDNITPPDLEHELGFRASARYGAPMAERGGDEGAPATTGPVLTVRLPETLNATRVGDVADRFRAHLGLGPGTPAWHEGLLDNRSVGMTVFGRDGSELQIFAYAAALETDPDLAVLADRLGAPQNEERHVGRAGWVWGEDWRFDFRFPTRNVDLTADDEHLHLLVDSGDQVQASPGEGVDQEAFPAVAARVFEAHGLAPPALNDVQYDVAIC